MGRADRKRVPIGRQWAGMSSPKSNGRLCRRGQREAGPPSSRPAPCVRKDAEAGGGASDSRDAAAQPHVEVAYHARAHPPSFRRLWEPACCKSRFHLEGSSGFSVMISDGCKV